MIRTWLLMLLALAAGAAVAWALRMDAGYVLLSYGSWIVETSLLGLLCALLLASLTLGAALRLLSAGFRLPGMVKRALHRRRAERARDSFESGLLKLAAGHWKRAEVELVRRAADHRASTLNYLWAARAAQKLGAIDRRDHYLALALRNAGHTEIPALLTQAEMQMENGELQAARASLQRLHEHDARHPYVVERLAECLAALNDWEALRNLLLSSGKKPVLSLARQRELLSQALYALIGDACATARLDRLRAVWASAPPDLRQETAFRNAYLRGLKQLGAGAEAAALIAEALAQKWDGECVQLYGELEGIDAVTQLATIEQWLTLYGERPELLLTAGRACLRSKLWGKARAYLETASRQEAKPAVFLELARLCEQTQQPDEAARYYRRGLEAAALPQAAPKALAAITTAAQLA